jgi:hypothetical protein
MAKTGPKIGLKAKQTVDSAATKAKAALPSLPDDFKGPSPNPHTNLVIADVALRGSALLARRAMERGLLGARYAPQKAKSILKGRTFGETLLHSAIARVAFQSVPGAIIVGGGLIAKTLYDRSRSRQALLEGEAKLHEMAKDGKK